MKQTETLTDILSEDFEIPDCTADLQELIKDNFVVYDNMPLNRKETTAFRRKMNELIEIYNERRNMKIYAYL